MEKHISFTPGNNGGSTILYYTVTSSGGQTATGGSSPITVTGLSNGSHTHSVTATNIVGTSSSSTISAPITPATVPDAPTIGSVTAGNGQATVTFTPPVSNGGSSITYYTVTSSGGQTATGGSSPITVLGLNNSTTYTFTVTATNAVGTSTPSSTSNSVTPATVPDAPTIGSVTAGNGQATVTFILSIKWWIINHILHCHFKWRTNCYRWIITNYSSRIKQRYHLHLHSDSYKCSWYQYSIFYK
ncbi:MAG: fibronectin type III domain-containing protein [Candidatus Paceibacterota bacterium]